MEQDRLHGSKDSAVSGKGHSVRLENVVKRFGNLTVVDHVNIQTAPGEFLTLLGPSGSGKTTTLRMISGLEYPTEGEIYIDEQPVANKPAYKRDLGMVFQNYALFPHMTVFDNIGFPMKMRGFPKDEISRRVHGILEIVHLAGFHERYPKQLSGGQQQRVALARALVFEPSILLMDEPLGALDKKLREEMQLEVKQIQERVKITTIYVTHDQSEALTMSDRIALMNNGKIEQLGSPVDIYEKPASRFVADFIGESNFFEGVVVQREKDWIGVQTTKGLAIRTKPKEGIQKDQKVNITLRPERVQIHPGPTIDSNQFVGEIKEVVYLGETIKYIVMFDTGDQVVVKSQNLKGEIPWGRGEKIHIGWKFENCFIV